jgi:hypothetical protein
MKRTNLPKPEPTELATLAAILCPSAEPEVAMKRAMAFYVEALFFVSELPKNFDAVMAYASENRKREHYIIAPLRADLEKARADTLELDPSEDEDPARRYLAAHGVCAQMPGSLLKRVRTVLASFRSAYNFLPQGAIWAIDHRSDAQTMINSLKRVKDGRTVYDIPRFWLDIIASQRRSHRAEQKESSRQRRKAAKRHAQKTGKKKKKTSSVRSAL